MPSKQKIDGFESLRGYLMKDFRTPKAWCPSCHERLDGCGTIEDEESVGPEPGDFTVCMCCSSVLRFKDDMTLRMLEEKDLDDMDDELKAKAGKIVIACKSIEPKMKERRKDRAEKN